VFVYQSYEEKLTSLDEEKEPMNYHIITKDGVPLGVYSLEGWGERLSPKMKKLEVLSPGKYTVYTISSGNINRIFEGKKFTNYELVIPEKKWTADCSCMSFAIIYKPDGTEFCKIDLHEDARKICDAMNREEGLD